MSNTKWNKNYLIINWNRNDRLDSKTDSQLTHQRGGILSWQHHTLRCNVKCVATRLLMMTASRDNISNRVVIHVKVKLYDVAMDIPPPESRWCVADFLSVSSYLSYIAKSSMTLKLVAKTRRSLTDYFFFPGIKSLQAIKSMVNFIKPIY